MLSITSLPAQDTGTDSLRIEGFYNQLSQYCYTQLDSTLHYLDLLLAETQRLGWTEEQAYAYLWGILCTGYHDQIDLKYELLSEAEKLLGEKGAALDAATLDAIDLDLRMHWGDYYMETGGYNGALDIYENLAANLEATDHLSDEEFQRLVICYQYLATIHRQRGSYREAIDYSFRALDYERQYYATHGNTDWDQSQAYSRIAVAYWLLGERGKALNYYRPAFENTLSKYTADPTTRRRNRKRLIGMGQELGTYYLELQKTDSALYYLEAVTPFALPEEPVMQELRLEKARAWSQAGQFTKALDTLQLAISRLEGAPRNRGSHLLLGKLYYSLGDIFAEREDYEKGLANYQKALTYLSDEFQDLDAGKNPTITPGNANRDLLHTLIQKTRLLYRHPPDASEKWLQAAWASAQSGMDLIDSIKLNYTSDYDKQYLLADSYDLYELALDILYQKGGTDARMAFQVMEKSKAVALYAAVRDLHARTYAGVPEGELEKMRRLQYQLSKVDAQLEQATTEQQQLTGRDEKLALQRSYNTLIRSFEQKYPDYYRLKYKQADISLEDIDLPKGQLLVEYFMGQDHLYAFVYSRAGAPPKLHQLPWSAALSQWATELKTNVYQQDNQAFTEKAYALYQSLLEPVLTSAGSFNRLLIIPDGVLGYLPFDILLTEAVNPAAPVSFRDYPYLMQKMAVSQNYSLGMLREMQRQHTQEAEELLAFAPNFPGNDVIAERSDRASLGELFYNEEEATAVLQSFNGRLITDQQATKEQFLELASRYRIYHIASHAVVDDENPSHSYIAFAGDPNGNPGFSQLYSYEILAQSFPADLVVLSACETGVGKVVRGEGIMSLARAFSYAGARSLVTSLWNINDQSGQALMAVFYQQLRKGLPKDEALRQAKLAYLKIAPDNTRTHPRYWAAFVPTGNMEALAGHWTWQWMVIALAGLGIFFLVMKGRRR